MSGNDITTFESSRTTSLLTNGTNYFLQPADVPAVRQQWPRCMLKINTTQQSSNRSSRSTRGTQTIRTIKRSTTRLSWRTSCRSGSTARIGQSRRRASRRRLAGAESLSPYRCRHLHGCFFSDTIIANDPGRRVTASGYGAPAGTLR